MKTNSIVKLSLLAVASGGIITGFAGQPVGNARSLKLAVASHKPGEQVDLKVLRQGTEKSISTTLDTLL